MRNSIFLMIIGIMALGCKDRQEKADKLLSDPKMEDEIYSAIVEDSIHLSKFMDKMMADEDCKKMMITKMPVLKMVCMAEGLDSLFIFDNEVMDSVINKMIKIMKADSVVCDRTCTKIVADPYLKKYFKKRAFEKE